MTNKKLFLLGLFLYLSIPAFATDHLWRLATRSGNAPNAITPNTTVVTFSTSGQESEETHYAIEIAFFSDPTCTTPAAGVTNIQAIGPTEGHSSKNYVIRGGSIVNSGCSNYAGTFLYIQASEFPNVGNTSACQRISFNQDACAPDSSSGESAAAIPQPLSPQG